MALGFIYDYNRCVACHACSAACNLENGWSFRPRMIYTFNRNALPSLPVINISLACNHCKRAPCLEGCPASAIEKDHDTGAVIVNDAKCIGCRYCIWNCPYDAPKYLNSSGVIGKCNLCLPRMKEGLSPACSTACPTGALEYGELADKHIESLTPILPGKDLEPALQFSHQGDPSIPEIIPYPVDNEVIADISEEEIEFVHDTNHDWSLIAFTSLTTLSVSLIFTAFLQSKPNEPYEILLPLTAAGFFSVFHLGRKARAWRAVNNPFGSPLSKEIILFLLFFILSAFAVFYSNAVIITAGCAAGVLLLLAIDSVYLFSDKRQRVFMHSGQTFLTALLVSSYFSGKTFPFLFIASIKIISVFLSLSRIRGSQYGFSIRYLRLIILVLTAITMLMDTPFRKGIITVIFLAGELIDRIFFYIDFNPLNIKTLTEYKKLPSDER